MTATVPAKVQPPGFTSWGYFFTIRREMNRTLEERVWDLKNKLHDMRVTATLKRAVHATRGAWETREDYMIPIETRVRLVMVSRFGDIGITEHLDSVHYTSRIGSNGAFPDSDGPNDGDYDDIIGDVQGLPVDWPEDPDPEGLTEGHPHHNCGDKT